MRAALRPDPLGLRFGLGDALLPAMVGAMAFLAALALGGAIAAQGWADRWRVGAGTALTAQIPRPADPADPPGSARSRLQRSLDLLRASPAIASVRVVAPAELDALLTPWLGSAGAVPSELLPAVIALRAVPDPPDGQAGFDRLAAALQAEVPDALLEHHAGWVGRLARLLRALEACGWGALALVGGVATLVIAAATRAALVARRATVDILHGLGATESYVAARFARRAMRLAAAGGATGTLLALPVLLGLQTLAAPIVGAPDRTMAGLPTALWLGLALLPLTQGAIGYATAHVTVRLWLRRLP